MVLRKAARAPRWWVVLALFALLVSASAAAAPEPIGAERCGACHEKEYKQWRRTAHARAFARLSETQQRDPTCRTCHTMAAQKNDPALSGVQCESCHGTGSYYAPDYVMRDPILAKLLGLEPVTAETCAPCHSGVTPSVKAFVYGEAIRAVDHKDVESRGADSR